MQKNSPVFAFPGFSPKIFLANYRTIPYNNACIMCRCDGIGRRDGLKIRWWRHRVGSSPTTGTTSEQSPLCSDVLLFLRNKRTSSARSLAPPFRIEPAALGFDSVWVQTWKPLPRKCSRFPKKRQPKGCLFFGVCIRRRAYRRGKGSVLLLWRFCHCLCNLLLCFLCLVIFQNISFNDLLCNDCGNLFVGCLCIR